MVLRTILVLGLVLAPKVTTVLVEAPKVTTVLVEMVKVIAIKTTVCRKTRTATSLDYARKSYIEY